MMGSFQANQGFCSRISLVRKCLSCPERQFRQRRFLFASRWLPTTALVAVVVSVGLIGPAQGLEPKWPSGSYKYLVVDQDIKEVLAEFGRNINVPIDVSNQVKGRLRGRLPTTTAKKFLDKLCESYGLVWYFDGAAMHISTQSEMKTEVINIGRLRVEDLTNELNKLGIADPRFPVRAASGAGSGNGVVTVSGPAPFIALVRHAVGAMIHPTAPVREEGVEDDSKVRVFRGNSSELLKPATAVVLG